MLRILDLDDGEQGHPKNKRNDHEYRLIERLHDCLASDVKITLLADRGFGDQKLYRFLQTLGWDFVIRFRGAIQVEDAAGVRQTRTRGCRTMAGP